MKVLSVVFSFILLFAIIPLPVQADGMGGGMMADWGDGLLDWLQRWVNGKDYAISHDEQRKQMEELNKQHYEDSIYLKYQIQMKEKELDALLNSSDPDIEKLRTLSRDIRELRSLAVKEQNNYEFEAEKTYRGYNSGGNR